MILPKDVLIPSTHGSFCCREGIRVNRNQRQMTIDHSDLPWIGGKQWLIGFVVPAATIWTLKIAELHDRDRSIGGTQRMKAFCGNVIACVLWLRGNGRIDQLT